MPTSHSESTNKPRPVFWFLLGSVSLIGYINLLIKHPDQDSITLGIGGILFYLSWVLYFLPRLIKRFPKTWKKAINPWIPLLFMTGLATLIGHGLSKPSAFAKIQNAIAVAASPLGAYITFVGTLLLAVFGYFLFVIKVKNLLFYAYLEITFALTSCYITVQTISTNRATVTIAALYLVVRGLDNRKKAIEEIAKAKKDAVRGAAHRRPPAA